MKTKFMVKISSLILVVIMCLIALVGCSAGIEMPASSAAITGNGGLAVQKGDYLYFVNGYEVAKDLSDGSNQGGNKYSAIYRTKLDSNKQLVYDEDGKLQNCELVIDKVCGFEKTQLYIFGDYIYYATPNTEKVISSDSDSLSSNFELTDFYKAKLDGSNRTLIYKTTRTSDSTKFAFYKVNGSDDVQLAVYDGTALIVVNSESRVVKTVCDSVSSVALPVYSDYNVENNQISAGAQNVYYTRSATDDENVSSGNIFCYANIADGVEHIIARGFNTYTVKLATTDALVYTKKADTDYKANNFVVSYAFNSNGELEIDVQNGGVQLDASETADIYLCTFENGIQSGIILKNSSNKLVYRNLQTGESKILNEDVELTPLFIYGTKVYAYSSDNSIYQIDYKTPAQKILVDMSLSNDENKMVEPYFEAGKNFSVCGGYVYYFAKYEGDEKTGYYLNRVTTATSEKYESQLVGIVQTEHIKSEIESE